MSPGRSPVCSVVMFWPSRCSASTTKSPLEVVSPGKTCSPTMGERGGIISSTTPVWRSISVSAPNEGLLSRPCRRVKSSISWAVPSSASTAPSGIGASRSMVDLSGHLCVHATAETGASWPGGESLGTSLAPPDDQLVVVDQGRACRRIGRIVSGSRSG